MYSTKAHENGPNQAEVHWGRCVLPSVWLDNGHNEFESLTIDGSFFVNCADE